MSYLKGLMVFACLLVSLGSYAEKHTVIVMSWDGMRHDFPDLDAYPGLKRFETEGIRAKSLKPVYPSNTFPGHVSLATGAQPEVHGILDNRFFDRKKGKYAYDSDANWLDAEPVWIAVERQGIKAATYFWVGSETDWRGQGQSYRIAPFDRNHTGAQKVDQMLAWLDLPEAERPQLIMSYWAGADHTAHTYGPDDKRVPKIIAEQDVELARFLAALDERELWASTTVILVSDHGMVATHKSAEIRTAVEDSGIKAAVHGSPALQHIFVEDSAQIETLYQQLQKRDHIDVYLKTNLPDDFHFAHPDRTGDIIVTTKPPYTLIRTEGIKDKVLEWFGTLLGHRLGMHGYDPELPDMHGIFLAMGRGVNKNKELGTVHQLDVAATITTLLGIKPPQDSIGKAIPLE